jgi:hydrogenase maturation protease
MSARHPRSPRNEGTALPALRPIRVLGLGNLIYADDGAGVAALERLRSHPGLPRGVELVDGGLFGVQVLGLIENSSRLLVLDAVDVGAAPGTVVRMTGEDLEGLPRGRGAHEFGASDILSLLRLQDRMPEEVVLLGIQPASIELGARLSPGVEAGLGRLVAEGLRQLVRWKRER